MYFLRISVQFFIFFSLFLTTNYLISQGNIFNYLSLEDGAQYILISSYTLLILSSFSVSLGVVFVIELITFISDRFLFRLSAFLFGLFQFYLNFTYFEFYLAFKTELIGSDLKNLETSASFWQLAEGLVWNIRFPFFIILPTAALLLTMFQVFRHPLYKKFVLGRSHYLIRLGVWALMLGVGIYSFSYYQGLANFLVTKENREKVSVNGNSLLILYQAISDYLQSEKKADPLPRPQDIKAIRKIYLEEGREFTSGDYPLLYRSSSVFPANSKSAKPKNVIILMMESFPSAEIHALSQNPDFAGTTPFLDSFLPKTLYFPNAYVSGPHTYYGFSDLLIGTASYHSQGWNTKLDMKFSDALPYLLRRNGYKEAEWFAGVRNSHYNFIYNFSKATGFNQTYFYKNFPPGSKDSNWGKSDREILRAAAREIKQFKGPFLTYVLSLTKHGPFNTPPDFDEEGFSRDFLSRHDGKIPGKDFRNSYRLIYYYDHVLREFFDTLEGNPNFENSLVILTSDQASFPNFKGKNLYDNMKNGFNIPLIFYEPGRKTLPIGRNEVFASHLDIIPTLINYLGLTLPEEVTYQGRDLLNPIYQQSPDRYFHIGFWQNDLIHFTREGMYKTPLDPKQEATTLVGLQGEEIPSTDSEINRMMTTYKKVYPYLVENSLVFPPFEKSVSQIIKTRQ